MGIPNPRKEMEKYKPVDNSSKESQNEGIENLQNEGIYTDNTNTINTSSVCMDLGVVKENKEEFWKDEDWPLVKALGDSRVDPESEAGITFAKIAKELMVNADQLKEALYILFNAKFHIKNPFGFVKKVLRDFI